MLTPNTPNSAGVSPASPSNGAGAPQPVPQQAPQPAVTEPVVAQPIPVPPPQPTPASQAAPVRPPTVPLASPGQMPAIAQQQQQPGTAPAPKTGAVDKVKDFAKENKGLLAITVAFLGGFVIRRNNAKPPFPGPPNE